jgi:hypothetical protein
MRPSLEKNASQKRAGEVTEGTGPEFKPQYYKKKRQFSDLNEHLIFTAETQFGRWDKG